MLGGDHSASATTAFSWSSTTPGVPVVKSDTQIWVESVSNGDEHAELLVDTTWGKKNLSTQALDDVKKGALKLLKLSGFHVDVAEVLSDRRYLGPPALSFARLDGTEKDLLVEEMVFVANSGVGYGHCSPVVITTTPQEMRGACITGLAYRRILQGRAPVLLAVLEPRREHAYHLLHWEAEAARLQITAEPLVSSA